MGHVVIVGEDWSYGSSVLDDIASAVATMEVVVVQDHLDELLAELDAKQKHFLIAENFELSGTTTGRFKPNRTFQHRKGPFANRGK